MVSQAPRLGPNIMPMGKKRPPPAPPPWPWNWEIHLLRCPVAEGTRPLPPNPWITRKMIKSRALGAKLHRSDPMAKIETKTRKVVLRPRASLILPEMGKCGHPALSGGDSIIQPATTREILKYEMITG